MQFLCDVHIALKISKHLENLGHNSTHVNNILDKWNTSDKKIARYADEHDQIVITKDQDFRNSFLLKNKPKKLIKIDLGNISNTELISTIETLLPNLKEIDAHHSKYMIEISSSSFYKKTVL